MVSADTGSVVDRAKRSYAERLQATPEADHRVRLKPSRASGGSGRRG